MKHSVQTTNLLKKHLEEIKNSIENCFEGELGIDDQEYSAFDYTAQSLDIEYILDSSRNCLGGRLLVGSGGPNIWIDTRAQIIEGYWENVSVTLSYEDDCGLNDAVIEFFNECN